MKNISRRNFLKTAGIGIGASVFGLDHVFGLTKSLANPPIQGFEDLGSESSAAKIWTPVSDRKVKVGLVGYGVCQFAAVFGFQDHPNVEVVAVSDLIPSRCAELARVTRCKKTYSSLEELVKDDSIEAVYVATDAPHHVQHCLEVLKHGKHVACAVPAVFGSLEDADKLYEAVKRSGLIYMMFETSMFREDLYAMRQIYNAGGFGKIMYTEGEYWHYSAEGIDSYLGWRDGMPPQWYPTHSDAYYVGMTGGYFTEVSCVGIPSQMERFNPKNNKYKNPFATEISMYRTNEGGVARMARSSDTIGHGFGPEVGRTRGTKGSYYGKYDGSVKNLPDLTRPAIPPGTSAGGHGGSHMRLTDEFITSILQNRKPLVDVAMALNLTVGGIVAHQSAMKDGELLKIPHYTF